MAGSLVKSSLFFLAAASLSAAAPAHHHKQTATRTGATETWAPSSTAAWSRSTATFAGTAFSTGSSSSNNAAPSGNAASSSGNSSSSSLKPNGKKAGSAGGTAVQYWASHLGWWYDWTPQPGDKSGVEGIPMLWGDGDNGQQDAKRWKDFDNISSPPKYLMGFNEPDCSGADTSAHMTVDKAVSIWNDKIAPWGEKGSLLGSPSMCMQSAETWLKQFSEAKLDRMWDFTTVHIYKKDMDGVKKDLDHYAQYGKPIWVTEFACVDDQNGFTACSDQGEINQWVEDAVDLFEADDRVLGFAYIDGGGLNPQTLPVDDSGKLTETGRTYLKAISKYS